MPKHSQLIDTAVIVYVRVYVTVRCPSVSLSQLYRPLQRVCWRGPGRQEISIDFCTTGAQQHVRRTAARRSATKASSVTFQVAVEGLVRYVWLLRRPVVSIWRMCCPVRRCMTTAVARYRAYIRDSDVILFHIFLAVDFCRHLVGKTLRNVCHCDIA